MTAEWIFDEVPASGARSGGAAPWQVFSPEVATFVREVLQNANDQKREDANVVHVIFSFEVLSGGELDSFLDGCVWAELAPHLDGAAESGFVTISPRLRAALSALEDARSS